MDDQNDKWKALGKRHRHVSLGLTGPDDHGGVYVITERDGQHYVKYPWGQELRASIEAVHFWKLTHGYQELLSTQGISRFAPDAPESVRELLEEFCQWVKDKAFQDTRPEDCREGGDGQGT